MNRLALVLALAALALAACSDTPGPEPVEPPKPAKPPVKPVEPPKPIEPTPAPAPTLTAEAAQALLDGWLAAQNDGDFEAYEATYAPRFLGIKRAGPRTSRYDRAGWMKDRQRMFQKPMKVTAEDVRITPGPGTARVLFTQTWASGDYRDTGPKQLVLTLHDKAPRIAREEMLQSTVLGPAPAEARPGSVRFVRMLDAPYVILGEPVETDAEPVLLARGRPHAVRAAVAKSPHVGRAVTLYGPNGRRCGGTIAEVVVLGLVIPHFGAVQTWDGEMEPGGHKASKAEIAVSVWSMSGGGGHYLAGRVDKAANDCAGATFARLEGPADPVAATWAPGPVEPALQNAALAQLRQTDAWKGLQADYVAQSGEQGTWDAAGVARTTARKFTAPGGAAIVVIDLDAGLGCGSFGGGLWQAFRVVPGGAVQPVGEPMTTPFTPATAIDRPASPIPALIGVEGYSGDGALFEPKEGAYVPASRLPILDLDCPC